MNMSLLFCLESSQGPAGPSEAGPVVGLVLGVLAAAGSGPVLPFDVLEAALHPQP